MASVHGIRGAIIVTFFYSNFIFLSGLLFGSWTITSLGWVLMVTIALSYYFIVVFAFFGDFRKKVKDEENRLKNLFTDSLYFSATIFIAWLIIIVSFTLLYRLSDLAHTPII